MARGSHSASRSARAHARPGAVSPVAGSPVVGSPGAGRVIAGRPAKRSRGGPLIPRLGNDPGDRLIIAGVVLFAGGLIAIALTFLPFLTLHRNNTDLAVNLGTFSTVIGLVVGVFGAYRQTRSMHR